MSVLDGVRDREREAERNQAPQRAHYVKRDHTAARQVSEAMLHARARVRVCVCSYMCVLACGRLLMNASLREFLMGSRANLLYRLPAFDDEIH